jgi:hypothetical protein
MHGFTLFVFPSSSKSQKDLLIKRGSCAYRIRISPFFSFSKIIASKALNSGRKKMARNLGVIVCLLIMLMDIVAGILGIEAEIAQNKVFFLTILIQFIVSKI